LFLRTIKKPGLTNSCRHDILSSLNKRKEQSAMAATEAKLRGNKKHIDKLDRIMIQPRKEEGQLIRAAAAATGESLQKYILNAVRARMESEGR
jgi:hypothetical protein